MRDACISKFYYLYVLAQLDNFARCACVLYSRNVLWIETHTAHVDQTAPPKNFGKKEFGLRK